MKQQTINSLLQGLDCTAQVREFIEKLYSYTCDESVDVKFFHIAKDLYAFLESCNETEDVVRIFNPTVKNNGWEEDATVVEVVTSDKPFLVDSVTESLKREGYNILTRINSVIPRIINGKQVMQSVMYFSISQIKPDKVTALKAEIATVLQMVKCCVEDWNMMIEKVGSVIEEVKGIQCIKGDVRDEIAAFLSWLKRDNFIFLGYAEYSWKAGDNAITRDNKSKLGIPKLDTAIYDIEMSMEEKSTIYITRSDRVSKVHRAVNMDCIGVRRYNKRGEITGEVRFLGLLTSIVYYQDVRLIPIIRKKIAAVEDRSRFLKGSHNHKALITVLQDFPRAELLHIPERELYDSCMGILSLSVREEVKLFVHLDEIGKFVRCIIFVPRDKFSTALWVKMQKLVAKAFNAQVINEQIRDSGFVRLQLILKIESVKHSVNIQELESELREVAREWREHLNAALIKALGEKEGEYMYTLYKDAFPLSYQEAFSASSAVYDLQRIERVRKTREVESDLYCDHDKSYHLKIYIPKGSVELYDMLPVIDNMGIKITNHSSYIVNLSTKSELLIHHFVLAIAKDKILPLTEVKEKFESALSKIWKKEVENDYYNSLILMVGLSWREVLLLRAWGNYLKQIRFHYNETFIQQALFNHTNIVCLLIKLFHTRFSTSLFTDIKDRKKEEESLLEQLEDLLSEIDNLAEDKIIRVLIDINMSIVRTNYYCNKDYVSFKIVSSKIQILPLPKPFVEIYVYSHLFEAIHLRGGLVARGGLRWSDRTEDFRTEVLGLMKAQMPKNTVIVPLGSKGGFVVKGGKDYDTVVLCYKNFLRAMLDVTDNINGDTVLHPQDMVIYDGEDPYLVVAADKGTATFSDYANEVANEYNFWLGDAFASGGSSGYDHKEMSITSRGAWVAAQNHLWVLGHDSRTELTMVGIGDMSGDVFGNGLLLSKKFKLIMAFNHMHIFIDPKPDAAISFVERERLFKLKRSTWMDYDKKLISNGGGVFSRCSKFIPISPEVQKVFGITDKKLDPDSLIRAGLQAQVDIIWNGGVGTFIKANSESNDVVGDKSNDGIRIDGKDVRAQIIVEGGNLGCTQLGRIEYAQDGGYINTDFIDNSAGVNCSDMEVNIKIALSQAVLKKKITIKERDQLMESMQEEVAKMILHNTNFLQARALTVAKMQAVQRVEQYHRLVLALVKEGRLNRKVEFIPKDEDFRRLYAASKGLTGPEIAVIIAYAKMSMYDDLAASSLPDDDYLVKYLVDYFPKQMRKLFYDEIVDHRLKREIITTQLLNSVVNRMGCIFIPGLVEYTGVSTSEIVKIYISVCQAYKLDSVWLIVDQLKIDVNAYYEIAHDISKFVKGAVHWFIRNYPQPINIKLTIAEFKANIATISQNIKETLDAESLVAYNNKLSKLLGYGISESHAVMIANLEFMSSALPIVQVTNNIRFNSKMQIPLMTVSQIYFRIGHYLKLTVLRNATLNLKTSDYWHRLSIESLLDDLEDQQMKLTCQVAKELQNVEDYEDALSNWSELHAGVLKRYNNMVNDLTMLKELDLSRLIIIIKSLVKIE